MDLQFLAKNILNLVFRKRLDFEFDRIPMSVENMSFKKRVNLLKIGLNRFLDIAKPIGDPYMAHIDPAGICNLKCFNCPVGHPEKKAKCVLSFENYRKFVDEVGDSLLYMILWSWGEPLLNPDFYRMTAYAAQRGILTVTSTNLNKFSREEAEKMMNSGLTALIVAMDSTDPDTYERLRAGAKYDRFMNNLDILMEARKNAEGPVPFINLRMVVSKDNEHEIGPFKQLAQEKQVDMVSFKAYSTRQSCEMDASIDKDFAPDNEELRWYRYHSDFTPDAKVKKYNCKFPWTKPMLFADGTITSCEFDLKFEHTFGNIADSHFKEIWFSEEANRFRKVFLKNRDSIQFCRNCVYDYKLIPGCVLSREFIAHQNEKN